MNARDRPTPVVRTDGPAIGRDHPRQIYFLILAVTVAFPPPPLPTVHRFMFILTHILVMLSPTVLLMVGAYTVPERLNLKVSHNHPVYLRFPFNAPLKQVFSPAT